MDRPEGRLIRPTEPLAPRSEVSPPAARVWVAWLLKGGLTLLLLGFVTRRVPLAAIGAAFARLDWAWAALSVLVFVPATSLVESARLHTSGSWMQVSQPGYLTWLRLYLESRPFFLLLPAGAGSEGILWLRLRALGWSHSACGFVLLANRVWGAGIWGLLAALVLTSANGFGPLFVAAPSWLSRPWAWAGPACLLLALPLWALGWAASRRGWPIRSSPMRVASALALALAGALVASLSAWMAARAAALPFHPAQVVGILAFFNFAMVLPVSLGGFGLQEAIILLLGRPLGMDAGQLLAFSALLHLQRLVLSGIGLGVHWKAEGAERLLDPGTTRSPDRP